MSSMDRRDFVIGSMGFAGMVGLSGRAAYAQAQPAPPPARQTCKLIVNTYGGLYERYWRSEVVPTFSAQTGITPILDIGVGKIFAANLRAAGTANMPYSCVLMNENIAAQLRDEG